MKILVSGSSGFIGKRVVSFFSVQGHQILKLVRVRANLASDEIGWDLDRGVINPDLLEGLDAVIHLAGENIHSSRWTEAKKQRIRDSRVKGTDLLCRVLAQLQKPPKVMISASAIGYYGDRGNSILKENSPKGTGFLADVCSEWEEATLPAQQKGIRVVNARFGVVLSAEGSILKELVPLFKWCLGGPIGSGHQYMSWITIDDLLNALEFFLKEASIKGPVNVVSPIPVTNSEFTTTLGRILHRPTFMRLPNFMVRLLFGEEADAVILASARVMPEVLMRKGFGFNHPHLDSALRYLLNRN